VSSSHNGLNCELYHSNMPGFYKSYISKSHDTFAAPFNSALIYAVAATPLKTYTLTTSVNCVIQTTNLDQVAFLIRMSCLLLHLSDVSCRLLNRFCGNVSCWIGVLDYV
jgi:hypothetical protein